MRFFTLLIVAVAVMMAPHTCGLLGLKRGDCSCGLFRDKLGNHENPIMLYNTGFQFYCNYDMCHYGDEMGCKQLCDIYGEAHKWLEPESVCQHFMEGEEGLQPVLFARTCEYGPWEFTGLGSRQLICCSTGKPQPCSSRQTSHTGF